MASAVASAFEEERPLFVEAGTGTGKTLGYLVPALLSGRRIIVSTGTRTLQDQIARHELPMLADLLPTAFTWTTLKGISNYVCRRRLTEQLVHPNRKTERELMTVHDWIEHSPTGDRAELDLLSESAAIWPLVTAGADTRLGPRCPHFERCFVTKARRAADKADLVLVNHHLFFADLALRSTFPGARVLPDYDAVIFDEAHLLEDVITEHFGVAVSTAAVTGLLRDAGESFRQRDDDGVWNRMPEAPQRMLARLERTAASFFHHVRGKLTQAASTDGSRMQLPEELFAGDDERDAWFQMDDAIDEVARYAVNLAEDWQHDPRTKQRSEALVNTARRAQRMRDAVAAVAEMEQKRYTYWGELRGPSVALKASPIDVAPVVRETLLELSKAVVFTSATLTADGEFDFIRQRLGLGPELADELRIGSPFDYASQALLYLPRDLPEPREPAFIPTACERIVELLAITSGRAFVLFTSHRALREMSKLLPAKIDYPIFVQGQEPRGSLLEKFRNTKGAVLLATGAFWEGVDVPGDALSMVIIDKLPFASPSDPLAAARMHRVQESGNDPFNDYQLPQAALALRQGFGRLIRRTDDRGIVAILDNRILSRRYGRVFLSTLPQAIGRTAAIEQVRRWWNR
jgi:ATP-dependent DNA helicase DinG